MPRSLRRDKALSALETAVESVESAIVALGGRVRQRSVKKNLRLFTVRQYLEGISSRLHVCLDLLQVDAVVSGRFPVDGTETGRFPSTRNESNEPRSATATLALIRERDFYDGLTKEEARAKLDEMLSHFPEVGRANVPTLRDSFETAYDQERQPLC